MSMSLKCFYVKGAAAIVFLATLMIGMSAAADENVRGWYELGATVIEDAKLEAFFDQPVADNKVKFDPGFRAAIAIGMDVTRYLAVEAEGGFHYNGIRSVGGATSSLGDLYQFPVMGNLVLQFPNRTRLVPVIGGGVGAVFSILDARDITLGTDFRLPGLCGIALSIQARDGAGGNVPLHQQRRAKLEEFIGRQYKIQSARESLPGANP